jgi:hypothetical protein
MAQPYHGERKRQNANSADTSFALPIASIDAVRGAILEVIDEVDGLWPTTVGYCA